MTSLAGGVSYDTAKFKNVGDSVSGRIIDFADVQERDFNTKEPKWWGEDNKAVGLPAESAVARGLKPVLQVRITLETTPGDSSSRQNLYVSGQRMRQAVKTAMAAAGASDLSPQSDIFVQFTGYDGQAKTYVAKYSQFDATAAAASLSPAA